MSKTNDVSLSESIKFLIETIGILSEQETTHHNNIMNMLQRLDGSLQSLEAFNPSTSTPTPTPTRTQPISSVGFRMSGTVAGTAISSV